MPGNETVYKSPRTYLPVVWARNNVPQGTSGVLDAAGLPAGLSDFPVAIGGSVTGILAVLSQAITAGDITITLRKNGSSVASQAVVAPVDGTTKVVNFPPGKAEYAAGDTIGLHLSAASGLTPNAVIDLAAYVEFQSV